MQITIKLKMLLMGIFIAVAICLMAGSLIYSDMVTNASLSSMQQADDMNTQRREQLSRVIEFKLQMTELTLAAMDSIIDMSSGIVAPDIMEQMETAAAFLTSEASTLVELADTDEEKQLAQEVADNVTSFIKACKTDLPQAIRDSVGRADDPQILARFAAIDDSIDHDADIILSALIGIEKSVAGEVEEAMAAMVAVENEMVETLEFIKLI
ncbi:MAG: hypothetical protein KKC99_10065, partial [Proteobacteria bacterium]|nr:hypothetical protein [Pseudomonadota bacterium]